MGRITTHILDTQSGRPASGVKIEIFAVIGEACSEIRLSKAAEAVTNSDGRTDAPLLEGLALKPGAYELHFHVGPYLEKGGSNLPEPKFLDTVVIRFGIASPSEHCHVPLLLQAHGYSTYRGS